MSLLFTEGFEAYLDARATPNGSQAVWVKGYVDQNFDLGAFGGWCLRHTATGGVEDINRDFPNGDSTTGNITIGFAWKVGNLANRPIMRLNQYNSGTSQFTIYENSDGSIAIRNGNSGTVLGTSATGLISASTWVYIEVQVVIANSGSAVVRLNGSEVINVTGVDTMGAANANVGRVNLPENGDQFYDDIYVRDDLTFMGPGRIIYRRPLSLVAGGDFNDTATAANIYPLLLDDQTADTTSYMTADTVGDEQFFLCENLLKLSGSTVKAIQVIAFAKVDAGTGQVVPVVSSNGDEFVGANWGLTTTFAWRFRPVEVDPDTSAAWDRTALALAHMGLRVTGMTGASAVQVSLFGYEAFIPTGDQYSVPGGHRYWSLKGITNNGGIRPGTWMLQFYGPDGEFLIPKRGVDGSQGGLWSGSNDYRYASDGNKNTGYISGSGTTSTRLSMDFGGPVIPTKFFLGSQTFLLSESFRTYTIDYSDDGVNWTTLYTETTPQTGWASGEFRSFALPPLSVTSRRRQTLVIN